MQGVGVGFRAGSTIAMEVEVRAEEWLQRVAIPQATFLLAARSRRS
jgi:hypothetical protein